MILNPNLPNIHLIIDYLVYHELVSDVDRCLSVLNSKLYSASEGIHGEDHDSYLSPFKTTKIILRLKLLIMEQEFQTLARKLSAERLDESSAFTASLGTLEAQTQAQDAYESYEASTPLLGSISHVLSKSKVNAIATETENLIIALSKVESVSSSKILKEVHSIKNAFIDLKNELLAFLNSKDPQTTIFSLQNYLLETIPNIVKISRCLRRVVLGEPLLNLNNLQEILNREKQVSQNQNQSQTHIQASIQTKAQTQSLPRPQLQAKYRTKSNEAHSIRSLSRSTDQREHREHREFREFLDEDKFDQKAMNLKTSDLRAINQRQSDQNRISDHKNFQNHKNHESLRRRDSTDDPITYDFVPDMEIEELSEERSQRNFSRSHTPNSPNTPISEEFDISNHLPRFRNPISHPDTHHTHSHSHAQSHYQSRPISYPESGRLQGESLLNQEVSKFIEYRSTISKMKSHATKLNDLKPRIPTSMPVSSHSSSSVLILPSETQSSHQSLKRKRTPELSEDYRRYPHGSREEYRDSIDDSDHREIRNERYYRDGSDDRDRDQRYQVDVEEADTTEDLLDSNKKKRQKRIFWSDREINFLVHEFSKYGNYSMIEWKKIAHLGLSHNIINKNRKNVSTAIRDKLRNLIQSQKICELCFNMIDRSDTSSFTISCSNLECNSKHDICKGHGGKKSACKAIAHRDCILKRDGCVDETKFLCNHCKEQQI